MSDTTMFNGVDLASMDPADLIKIVQETQSKLAALEAAKPAKAHRATTPREKTADQLAKEAAREAFESVTLEDEGSLIRLIQDADRYNALDAGAKMLRALPYDRVARVVADLVAEVADLDGANAFDVAAAALVRKKRTPKDTATVDAEIEAAADAETSAE
jgi:hypothetical protein